MTARFRVFRNLTSRCMSIQARLPGRGWRTVAHADSVVLADATFDVRESGRHAVIRSGKKNVHAWIEGKVAEAGGLRFRDAVLDMLPSDVYTALFDSAWRGARPVAPQTGDVVTYNPFRFDSFVTKDECRPIRSASRAYASPHLVIAE